MNEATYRPVWRREEWSLLLNSYPLTSPLSWRGYQRLQLLQRFWLSGPVWEKRSGLLITQVATATSAVVSEVLKLQFCTMQLLPWFNKPRSIVITLTQNHGFSRKNTQADNSNLELLHCYTHLISLMDSSAPNIASWLVRRLANAEILPYAKSRSSPWCPIHNIKLNPAAIAMTIYYVHYANLQHFNKGFLGMWTMI